MILWLDCSFSAHTALHMQVAEDVQKPVAERKVLYSHFGEDQIEEEDAAGNKTQRKYTSVTLLLADATMLQNAAEFGHARPLFMDTTFAINRYKFSFLSILAMDHEGKGVPVAWAVLPNEQTATITTILQEWKSRVQEQKPDFEPSCFITDDSDAEQAAMQCVPSFIMLANAHTAGVLLYALLVLMNVVMSQSMWFNKSHERSDMVCSLV